MRHWEDVTSFSKNDKDRTPKTWLMTLASGTRMVVTRHIDYPGKWIIRCDPYIDMQVLRSDDIDKAKEEAIKMIWMYVKSDMDALSKMLPE
jgi:hypothetical protein